MTLADELLKRIPPRQSEGRVIRFYAEEELPQPVTQSAQRFREWKKKNPEKVRAQRERWNETRRMRRVEMLNRKYFGA